jgi:hypothetical protein
MHARVRQLIMDEEEKARALEQEIAEMQREELPHQQSVGTANQNIYHFHQPSTAQVAFQGLNYLDKQSPMSPQLQASPWPQNYKAGTYPKYNGSIGPT